MGRLRILDVSRVLRVVVAAGAAVGGRVLGRPATARTAERSADRLRYAAGVLDGLAYQLRGRAPQPDIDDDVLADRVRSMLGPVLKRHDLPRPNVMVEHGVVLLHGEVPSFWDGQRVVDAVRYVPGVRGVRPHLHVGLQSPASRPSYGRAHAGPSDALLHLRAAARDAGVDARHAEDTAAAVVRALLDRLPEGERAHVRGHLPADVVRVLDAARVPQTAREARSRDELVAAVTTAVPELDTERAQHAAVAVLAALRGLVPEETADVAAVLPDELRRLWQGADTGETG